MHNNHCRKNSYIRSSCEASFCTQRHSKLTHADRLTGADKGSESDGRMRVQTKTFTHTHNTRLNSISVLGQTTKLPVCGTYSAAQQNQFSDDGEIKGQNAACLWCTLCPPLNHWFLLAIIWC